MLMHIFTAADPIAHSLEAGRYFARAISADGPGMVRLKAENGVTLLIMRVGGENAYTHRTSVSDMERPREIDHPGGNKDLIG